MFIIKKKQSNHYKSRIYFVVFILILSNVFNPKTLLAQELNFNVDIQLSPSLPTADNSIYEDMEDTIYQFLNDTKWTDDIFQDNELIECNLILLITERPDVNSFIGELNIQLARPVYNSSYNTMVLNLSQNYADTYVSFEYTPSQRMNYVENVFENELTSILVYYALTVIGLDYDTFSLLGGSKYYEQVRKIVFQREQTELQGWIQNTRPPRNRYWLNENLISKQLQPVREAIYEYHRLGLDLMYNNETRARVNILKALRKIKEVYDNRNDAFIIILFLYAKESELIKIFSKGDLPVRRQVYNLLVQMQPTRQSEYLKIIK